MCFLMVLINKIRDWESILSVEIKSKCGIYVEMVLCNCWMDWLSLEMIVSFDSYSCCVYSCCKSVITIPCSPFLSENHQMKIISTLKL